MGWSLEDIVNGCHGTTMLEPRIVDFGPRHGGREQYIDEIRAVVLLGSDLGDLIVPDSHSTQESLLRRMPAGHDLMACTYSTLERIAERNGAAGTFPRKLTDRLYWHQADRLFDDGVHHDGKGDPTKNAIKCVQTITSPGISRPRSEPSKTSHAAAALLSTGSKAAFFFGRTNDKRIVWAPQDTIPPLDSQGQLMTPKAMALASPSTDDGQSDFHRPNSTFSPGVDQDDLPGPLPTQAQSDTSGRRPDAALPTLRDPAQGMGIFVSPSMHDSGYSTKHGSSEGKRATQQNPQMIPARAASVFSAMNLRFSELEERFFVTQLAERLCLSLKDSTPIPDIQISQMSAKMSTLLLYLARLSSSQAASKVEKTTTSVLRSLRE